MSNDKEQLPYTNNCYEPPKTFVKSAVRVINVLEYFYRHRAPARSIDISKALEYPVSSTRYLLASLVDSGHLDFDKSTRRYFPSILFAGFSSWLSGLYPSGEVMRKLAAEAHSLLGGTVSITVQKDQHMRALIIEMDGTATPPSYDFRVRIPLVGSAGGLVALAELTDKELLDIVAKETAKLPPKQRQVTTEQLRAEIGETRQRGYSIKEHAIVVEGESSNLLVVAIRIPLADHMPLMVLAVSGAKSQLSGREAFVAATLNELLVKYAGLLNP